MADAAVFPAAGSARDRFVLERRAPRPDRDPWQHQGVIVEDERQADGTCARVATVLLTGRECPWRCTMCDLWRYTTRGDTPAGAIPAQIRAARRSLDDRAVPVAAIKLYNAGSFFDRRAVPESDYDEIAAALAGVPRVIVECHPALVGPRIDRFAETLARQQDATQAGLALEVAMGLETAHPAALDALNKRVTLEQFAAAAAALVTRGVSLRVFLLISPPFVPADAQDEWLLRSLDAAFSCGASVVSLVPTRAGNGALEALANAGRFRVPTLDSIEHTAAMALEWARGRGRVFVDLWDLDRFARCTACLAGRRERLHRMNLQQTVLPPSPCPLDHRVLA